MKIKRSLGVLLILGAAASFALMNYFVSAAGALPVMQKVFFRNLIATFLVLIPLLCEKQKLRIKGKETLFWLFLRAAIGFLGVVLNFYAIDHIGSISDASMLNKLSPFFAILFSVLLLKERPKLPEIFFVLMAFAGAMLVIRPSFSMEVLPALAGFAGGACAGFAYTCVRVLGLKGERGAITVFFFSAFSTLVSLPFFIAFYTPMSAWQLTALLLSGVSAAAGQFFITAAYRLAPAKEIAVFDYAQVIFAALLGYFLLDELPAPLSFAGYAVIFLAAFLRYGYGLFLQKKQTRSSPPEAPAPPEPASSAPEAVSPPEETNDAPPENLP